MNRFWAALALLPLISFLWLPRVSASGMADPTTEPTPTVQPTLAPFEVDVVVETEGSGIPNNATLKTDFGFQRSYRHDDLGPNHYRDFLRVQLNSQTLWIFDHEGNVGTGGQRNAESWVLVPALQDTPFTTTVSLNNLITLEQNTRVTNCNAVTGKQTSQVFILNRSTPYNIYLRTDYVHGDRDSQDCLAVTATIQ